MKISYTQIEEQCDEIHKISNKMKEIVDSITNYTNKISTSDVWNGEAADFYKRKTKKILAKFDEIFNELENSILYLANVAEGYQAIDKTVIKEICQNLNISEPHISNSKFFGRG